MAVVKIPAGSHHLVHFHYTVDLIYKPEAGEEANGACEKEEYEDHNHCVAKVQYSAGSANYLEFREEVVHCVDKQVGCCKATGQE